MAQEAHGPALLGRRRSSPEGRPRLPRLPGLPRVQRHGGALLVVGGPVPPGADAITFGRVVVVRRGRERSQRLLAHELVHVRQYADEGAARFLLGYVGRYLALRAQGWPHQAAYRRLPAEVHADWASRPPG